MQALRQEMTASTQHEPEICTAMVQAAIDAVSEPVFRGGALDNLEGAKMGKGHNNAGKPFDVSTACYLKPVFEEYDKAMRNGTRLKLVLKAGVKTVKSFSLEICAADHCCNRNGDTAIYFGSGDVSDDQATTRIVDFFKRIR